MQIGPLILFLAPEKQLEPTHTSASQHCLSNQQRTPKTAAIPTKYFELEAPLDGIVILAAEHGRPKGKRARRPEKVVQKALEFLDVQCMFSDDFGHGQSGLGRRHYFFQIGQRSAVRICLIYRTRALFDSPKTRAFCRTPHRRSNRSQKLSTFLVVNLPSISWFHSVVW